MTYTVYRNTRTDELLIKATNGSTKYISIEKLEKDEVLITVSDSVKSFDLWISDEAVRKYPNI